MEHPCHLHGQGTLSSTPYHPLEAPPSPWEAQPPLHFQHLSLLFLRSLPLCLQFLLLLLTTTWFTAPHPRHPQPPAKILGLQATPTCVSMQNLLPCPLKSLLWGGLGYGFLHFCSVFPCVSLSPKREGWES